jgi:nitric oxide reductase, NorZ apoprotein
MIIWLVLVWRAIRPAVQSETDGGGLTHMLLYSSVSIPLFYMAGLLYGKGSHLSDAEYWRWWVVHLWVEGFFEVFATVVMAFLLSHIGAVSKKFALTSVYFIVFLYLGSGVIGTFHHLYWSGSPTIVIALGAVFSALEVVPLSLLGFEAAHNLRVVDEGGKGYAYKWPIYFFVAVAFWNLVGAGVFGFLINPPIVLYYAQGINTTPIHSTGRSSACTACSPSPDALLRKAYRHEGFLVGQPPQMELLGAQRRLGGHDGLQPYPSGFFQFYHAVKEGLWFARSPEITSHEFIRTVTWMRMLPDVIFAVGAFSLLLFLLRSIWLSFLKKS